VTLSCTKKAGRPHFPMNDVPVNEDIFAFQDVAGRFGDVATTNSPRALGPLGHLILVRSEHAEDLLLLWLGHHLKGVKRVAFARESPAAG
jgi:hypothetical protein